MHTYFLVELTAVRKLWEFLSMTMIPFDVLMWCYEAKQKQQMQAVVLVYSSYCVRAHLIWSHIIQPFTLTHIFSICDCVWKVIVIRLVSILRRNVFFVQDIIGTDYVFFINQVKQHNWMLGFDKCESEKLFPKELRHIDFPLHSRVKHRSVYLSFSSQTGIEEQVLTDGGRQKYSCLYSRLHLL